MKYASICIALAVMVALCGFSGQATSEPKQSEIDSAKQLFELGKFAEAREIYAQIDAQDPKDYSVILQLGRIALLSNRLDDAQKWLEQAIALSLVTPTPRSCWPRRSIAQPPQVMRRNALIEGVS